MRKQLALSLAVTLAFSACGSEVERVSPEASGDGQSLAGFLACMRRVAYDYEPADTPAALARQADAVVTGSIVDLQPAGPDASVLEVEADRIIAGDDAVVVDGSVFVELDPFDHATCAATVPTAYGVFFLAAVEEGRTQTLVQGFLLEDADGRLVSVKEALEDMPPAWRDLESVDDVVARVLDRPRLAP